MEPGAAARDCGKRGFPEKRAFHFSRAGEFWRPPPGWEGQRLERGQSLSQPLEAPGSGESEQRLQPWLARDSLNTVEELRARLRRGRRLRGAGKRCGGPRLGEGWGGGWRPTRTAGSMERWVECQGRRAAALGLARWRLEAAATHRLSASRSPGFPPFLRWQASGARALLAPALRRSAPGGSSRKPQPRVNAQDPGLAVSLWNHACVIWLVGPPDPEAGAGEARPEQHVPSARELRRMIAFVFHSLRRWECFPTGGSRVTRFLAGLWWKKLEAVSTFFERTGCWRQLNQQENVWNGIFRKCRAEWKRRK